MPKKSQALLELFDMVYVPKGGTSITNPLRFGRMSNMTAIFIVALIGAGLYFFIWRPKRGK